MKTIRLQHPAGLDNLGVHDEPEPSPGPGEILIKAAASSLNFHDYLVVAGMVATVDGRIPMSDVAGEVVETADGVTDFAVGDMVMSTFFPRWLTGDAHNANTWDCIPGDTAEGYAREFVTGSQQAFTRIPAGYTFEEAATLPCAAVTAWRALFVEGGLQAGQTVLVQGTGGVSIFALQLAKAVGANVIATSSSDAKLEKVSALGADHVINYKQTPDWGQAAAAMCPSGGVDHVIEVGGPGTLMQSVDAVRTGGHISIIGVLTGMAGEVTTPMLIRKQPRIKAIAVGSRAHQLQLVTALDSLEIKPVIDARFALEDIANAFRYQESQQHLGKICLTY